MDKMPVRSKNCRRKVVLFTLVDENLTFVNFYSVSGGLRIQDSDIPLMFRSYEIAQDHLQNLVEHNPDLRDKVFVKRITIHA